MGSRVDFKDFSIDVKAAMNSTTIAWLHETANEVTAQAQRNCVMEDDAGKQLKGSYKNVVDDGKGEAYFFPRTLLPTSTRWRIL